MFSAFTFFLHAFLFGCISDAFIGFSFHCIGYANILQRHRCIFSSLAFAHSIIFCIFVFEAFLIFLSRISYLITFAISFISFSYIFAIDSHAICSIFFIADIFESAAAISHFIDAERIFFHLEYSGLRSHF
jgi:hypothetical protein